jgi:type II secretory pathway predicted ATPase ExeA
MSLDEHGLVDLSRLEKIDYSKLLVRYNPFPSTAVPSEVPLTTADRKPVLKRFTEVLSVLYNDQSSSVTVLLGDYGTGKSHLLKLFKASVNEKLLSSEKPILAAYVKSPGRNIREMFLNVVDDIGRDLLAKLAEKYVYEYLTTRGKQQAHLIRGKSVNLKGPEQINEYLKNATSLDLMKEIGSSLEIVKNPDLVRAFLALALPRPDLASYAWRWLLGSPLSKNERYLLNIDTTVDDSHIAEQVFIAFTKLLHVVGIVGIVILVDELEAISLIVGISKGVYQDEIRHLIDSNPTGMALFFAITPTEWSKLTQTPSALERRLAGSVFDLAPFERNDVHELIEKYLHMARTEDFRDSGKQRIFPFTEESIEAIFAKTKGIPSKVVQLCRLCIETLATCHGDAIDPQMVERVISEEGFR